MGSDEVNCVEIAEQFENGLNGSIISTQNSPYENGAKWVLVQGTDSRRNKFLTGPPFDHTYFNSSGHYLTNLGDNSQRREQISLVSKMFFGSEDSCVMKFYYYLFGM